jgi:hypothetical protein
MACRIGNLNADSMRKAEQLFRRSYRAINAVPNTFWIRHFWIRRLRAAMLLPIAGAKTGVRAKDWG